MQTQRLATLTNPTQVESLLDSYIVGSDVLPRAACKPSRWDGLPAELRHFAAQAIADGYVCSAWTDGEHSWLFAASLALERAREVGRPVLEIHRFEDVLSARVTVLAARLADGSWCHCGQ